ncbi:MAG: hypothetical protein ABI479_02435, partial [Gallionella sp.]
TNPAKDAGQVIGYSHSTSPSINNGQVAGYPASMLGDEREKQSLILGANESLRELVVAAIVLRENLVKLDGIPLTFRAPSLPELPANSRVLLAITAIDLLDLNVQTRFVATVEDAIC